MDIIAVDDKKIPLEQLADAIAEVAPGANIVKFRTSAEALEHAKQHKVDVAFLDIDMPGMNGVQLAMEIKLVNPTVNIIFATGYSEFMGDALSMHASGYLTKPITPAKVQQEMDDLRHPVEETHPQQLRMNCFGRFEVFGPDGLLEFNRERSKELLAYLVDKKGLPATNDELTGVLWEDESLSSSLRSQLRTLISDLRHTLEAAGAPELLIRQRGAVAVDTSMFSCDYYDFLDGKPQALNSYQGEYMIQYSWSEFTAAKLQMNW